MDEKKSGDVVVDGAKPKMISFEIAGTEVLVLSDTGATVYGEKVDDNRRAYDEFMTWNGAMLDRHEDVSDFADDPHHVDKWISDIVYRAVPADDTMGEVAFLLFHARLTAAHRISIGRFALADVRLLCTYNSNRYAVTGASRMGDITLHDDLDAEWFYGYTLRVHPHECTDWTVLHDRVKEGK